MAKTTSQIVAENKKRREQDKDIRASRAKEIVDLNRQRVQEAQEKADRLAESALRVNSYQNATKVNYFEEKAKAEANKEIVQQNKDILSNPKKYLKKWDAEKQNAKYQPGRDAIGAMTDEQRQALENANALNPGKVPEWVSKAYGDEQGKNIVGAYSNMKKEEEAVETARKLQEEQEKNRAVMEEQMTKVEAMTPEERKALELYNQMLGRQTLSGAPELYQGAMDDAMSTLNEYSNEEIAKMAEALRWSDSAERMEEVKENAREFGHEHPVIGSIGATGSNLIGAVTGPFGYLGEMANQTGQFSTLNPNNMGTAFQQQGAQLQGAVTEDIVGDGSSGIRRGLGYLYQGGMSLADSAARIAAAGPAGSLALAGMGSFSQTMQEASEKGATPAQATIMAAASAGLEVATEKIPLDDWLDIAKGGAQPVTDALLSAFKQAGVEATTEEISLIGGLIVEAAVMKEKSGYNQDIADMVAGGMSYDEAKATKQDDIWREVLDTAIVSGLSGAMSSAGGSIIAGVDEKVQNNRELEAYIAEDAAKKAAEADAAKAALEARDSAARQYYDQHPEEMITQEAIERIRGQETTQYTQTPGGLTQADIDQLGAQWANQEVTKEIPPMQPMTDEQIQAAADQVLGADSAKKLNVTDTEIQENIQAVGSMESVKDLTGREFVKGDGLKQRVIDFFGKIGKAYNSRVGEVLLTKKGVKDDFGHGMTDEKAAAFAAVPDVIKNGKVVQYEPNRKGKSYDSVTIVAPVTIDGEPYMTNVIAHRDNGESRFYLHDVYAESDVESRTAPPTSQAFATDENAHITETGSKADASTGNYGARGAHHPSASNSTISVMEQIWNVKKNNQGNVYNGESTPQVDTENVSMNGGQEGDRNLSAAEADFTGKGDYYDLLTDENTQRDRADDMRPMELPRTDVNGGKVSEVTGNVYGAKITTGELASLMEEPTARGDFSYVQISNDKAAEMARDTIAAGETWDNAFDIWKRDVDQGKAGAEMSARAAYLLNHYAQTGDKRQWLKTLHYTQILGTNTAQGLQAMRLIRNLDPQDKVEFTRMTIQRAVVDIQQQYKTKIDMEAVDPLIDKLETADTDAQRDEIIGDIQQAIADQVPSTALDKWTALRYTNMLGNLKTMERNVAGNIAMQAQYRAKDAIAALMEQIASKITKGKFEKTKSFTVGKPLLDACREDFQQYKGIVSGGGKYGDQVSGKDQFLQGVEDKRTIFNFKLMEWYRKGTDWAMNNEYFGDEAFGREGYARALAGYLKANGVKDEDLSKVDSKLMDKARAYAIQQAQEATFHDATALANRLSKLQKGAGVVGEAVVPFVKTPANVLVRAEEYSPLGVVNSLVNTYKGAKGEITGADVIDSWAKTFTGTGLFAIGAFLKAQGWINCGPDDDEDKANFDKMNGQQPYSVNLPGGGTYTFDWLNPTGMPMFMGAQFWDLLSSDRDITFADAEQIFTSIADPMIQMSMLQGLNDTLDGIKYTDNNLGQFLMNAAVSYLTQGLTNTLVGQLEKSTEGTRTYTYVDKDSSVPRWIQQALGKTSQKIPGWDFQQETYRNEWGETEEQPTGVGGFLYNTMSPGYYKPGKKDAVTDELNRLYEREGVSGNVLPNFQVKPVTYTDADGNKYTDHNMTAEEAETYKETAGQTAFNVIDGLVGSDTYKAMTYTEKGKAIGYAYDYAREKGRAAALDGYEMSDGWMNGIEGKEQSAIFQKVTDSVFDGAFDSLTSDWEYGKDTAGAMEDLDRAYESYQGMDAETQKAFREKHGGRIGYYLDAKENGVDTETFTGLYKQYRDIGNDENMDTGEKASAWSTVLAKARKSAEISKSAEAALKNSMNFRYSMVAETKHQDNLNDLGISPDISQMVTDALDRVTGTGSINQATGKRTVTNADKYSAIANLRGVSSDNIDKIMREWMPDYDPGNGKTEKTEVKYDYMRQEMGISAKAYAQLYKANSESNKKADKIAAFEAMGYNRKTAEQLYRIFSGNEKTMETVLEWYESR